MRNAQFRIIGFLYVTVVMIMTASVVSAEEYRVVGYYPAWMMDSYPADAFNVSGLTNIIYAFAWPEADGSIASYEQPSYPELTDRVHAAGGTITIALGGGGQSDGFASSTADSGIRATFIANILAFCNLYGYDGIDIDWEHPQDAVERDNLTAFVAELRSATVDRVVPFIITIAVSGSTWADNYWDFTALSPLVDWFNVMNYDYSGPWTTVAGHNAPLYPRSDLGLTQSIEASSNYLTGTLGVPKNKVVIGIPFYGRMFEAEDIYAASTGGDAYRYSDITSLLTSGEWVTYWDDISQVPYAINDLKNSVLVYDDEHSVAGKCRYVMEEELGGVMVWALGYDYTDGVSPLLATIVDTIDTSTSILHEASIAPSGIVVNPVTPNPFNMSATISYTLPREMDVTVAVYAVNGQRVAILREGWEQAGTHNIIWSGSTYAAGVYLVAISGDGCISSAKMTLLK